MAEADGDGVGAKDAGVAPGRMTDLWKPPTAEAIRRLREEYERPLTPDEYRTQSAVPLSAEEIEEDLELVRWFRRRYPTPAERSAYVRAAMARWSRRPID